MKVSGNGFLTKDGRNKTTVIKNRHIKAFRSYEKIIKKCRSVVLSVEMNEQATEKDRQKIIAIVLAVRLLEICEAALVILRHGLSNEADTLFRVFLDAYFIFVNVCLCPKFIVEYFRSDEPARLKLMNAAARHNSELFEDLNKYVTPEIKGQLKQKISEECIKAFKSEEYAKTAGCSIIYDSLYRLMSAPLHTTPRSLAKYVEEDENGNIIKIKYYPVEEDLPQRVYDFAYFLIKVIGGLKDVFEVSNENEIKAMIDELNRSVKLET
jgi:hypothetical protein